MSGLQLSGSVIQRLSIAAAIGVISFGSPDAMAQTGLSSSFTVQGALSDGGSSFVGAVDLRLRLFDSAVGGNQVGPVDIHSNVPLDNGIFSVNASFGPNAFLGDARWIEILVADAGSGNFTTLTPRQPALPTPNALFALKAGGAQSFFNVMGDDATIAFGPSGECSIGIDPRFPGLNEMDPVGFRLLGQNLEGCRLFFGPTDDCRIEINPVGPPGLTLLDPNCIRILNPVPNLPAKILFGPTDECSIGIDPIVPGLLLRDPRCVRILPTDPQLPPVLYWGPTDECSIGLVPGLPGLAETDPNGFRLLGQNLQGCRLIFGPTDDCTVEIDPTGPGGLLLRDITGIRLMNPDPVAGNTLFFGPTDECRIRAPEPGTPGAGMMFSDPRGFGFDDGFVGIGLRDQGAQFPLQVAGAIAAEEFIQFSSSVFKDNVQPLDNALDLVNALQGVTFDWKEMNDGRSDVGFIAEEVEKVLPELVRSSDGEASGIAYHRLTAVTVEAIKAQQQQIQVLSDERDDLAGRVAELESALALILAQLEDGGE
jgi:hypothetical protein